MDRQIHGYWIDRYINKWIDRLINGKIDTGIYWVRSKDGNFKMILTFFLLNPIQTFDINDFTYIQCLGVD